MNVVPWIVAHTVGALTRVCPHCQHRQFVPPKHQGGVRCDRCGKEIPAPPPDRGSG